MSVSTHVLDTASGRPAGGVPVTLDRWADGGWQRLGTAVTGTDGRASGLQAPAATTPVTCRLLFAVRDYLAGRPGQAFFPEVSVVFVTTPGEHYHVPLLLSPFGYTVYRGG